MNHPLWPVVRESARRIVRIPNITIQSPSEFEGQVDDLCKHISNNLPERISFPEFKESTCKNISIYNNDGDEDHLIIYIGTDMPAIETCWIEMDLEDGFEALMESCHQLLDAGYPGCVDCDNSIQESVWNEEHFRDKRK